MEELEEREKAHEARREDLLGLTSTGEAVGLFALVAESCRRGHVREWFFLQVLCMRVCEEVGGGGRRRVLKETHLNGGEGKPEIFCLGKMFSPFHNHTKSPPLPPAKQVNGFFLSISAFPSKNKFISSSPLNKGIKK